MLGQSSDYGSVFVASFALIVLCLVGYFAISTIRKRMKEDEGPAVPGAGGGFTLSDLREMHRSGQMSDEEFEAAKSLIVSAVKAQQATAALSKIEQKKKDAVLGATPPAVPRSNRHHHQPPTE